MTVYLVGAGPGDPGLLTRRGAELLARADVVVHDRLVDPAVLALAPAGAEMVDVGKVPAARPAVDPPADPPADPPRQAVINDLLVSHGRAGRTVVRLKGGDPFVFGRGGEEAEALSAAGVPWEVVPGLTSATAVPAAAGVPVTYRGLSTSVTVVTGQVGGHGASGGVDWDALAGVGGTLVILMGVATRATVAGRLMLAGRAPATPVAVIEWGTTPGQRVRRTTLDGLAALDVASPSVIVVGPVAALDLGGSPRGPLAGRTVVVTRAREQAGPLSAALVAAGARVVDVPLHEVVAPADGGEAMRAAAGRVATFDWVAFTSANAVHRFVPLLRDARSFGRCRLAAVGTGTASALRGYHLVADAVPGTGGAAGLPATAAGLAAAIGAAPGDAGTVLFVRAEAARPDLGDGLRRRGWSVEEVVAYRTAPAPPPFVPVAAAVAAADAITFASPRAVTGWLAQRDAAGDPLAVPPVVACIGTVTAEAAADLPGVVLTAADPSADALVAVLEAHFAGAPDTSG